MSMRVKKRHRLAAESTRFHNADLHLYSGRDETVALLRDHYLRAFDRMGYRIVYREHPGFSITLRRLLFLTEKWDDMSAVDQAALLAEEYCHALQHRGIRLFLVRFGLSPWFRWSVETQAKRDRVRAWRALGVSEENLRKWASGYDWSGYSFTRRFRRAVKDQTTRILLLP